LRILRWSDYLGGPKCPYKRDKRVPIREEDKAMKEAELERCSLKVEDGTTGQGVQVLMRCWKCQEWVSSKASRRSPPCKLLDVSQ
jgi:hypothetical protein